MVISTGVEGLPTALPAALPAALPTALPGLPGLPEVPGGARKVGDFVGQRC